MISEIDFENKGRLLLWQMALSECQRLLEMAARAENESQSVAATEKENRYKRAFQEFAQTQSDYVPGQSIGGHWNVFKKTNKREFGESIDCSAIKDWCRMLAIIFFCQIFNRGDQAVGKVAPNSKGFRDDVLNGIMAKIIKSSDEQKQFDELCELLKSARDKMIGHADGNRFDISHQDAFSEAKMFHTSLHGIDFRYWQSVVESMQAVL